LVHQITIFPSVTSSLVHISKCSAALYVALLFSLVQYHHSFKGLGDLLFLSKKDTVVQLPSHLYCTEPDHSCWCFALKSYDS